MKSKKGSYRDPVPEIGTHWDSADWGILEVLLTHFTEKKQKLLSSHRFGNREKLIRLIFNNNQTIMSKN